MNNKVKFPCEYMGRIIYSENEIEMLAGELYILTQMKSAGEIEMKLYDIMIKIYREGGMFPDYICVGGLMGDLRLPYNPNNFEKISIDFYEKGRYISIIYDVEGMASINYYFQKLFGRAYHTEKINKKYLKTGGKNE